MNIRILPNSQRRMAWTDRKDGYLELLFTEENVKNGYYRGNRKLLSSFAANGHSWSQAKYVDVYPEGFRANLSNLKGKEKTLIKAFVVAMGRFIVYFSIPFFIGLGLGVELDNLNLPLAISFGCYIWILSMFIVIPGGSGGAEAFFVLLFTNVFISSTGASLAAPGMLLWRFVTFHIPLIVCGIITLIFNKKKNAKFFQEVPSKYSWIFMKKHH